MTELTGKEREVLAAIIKKHIEEVKENEDRPEDFVAWEAMEVSYREFLEGILKKLQ